MLLSPEISIGAISKQQSIVVRIEDVLIVIILFTLLAKGAVNKKSGTLITKTPLNKFIAFYTIVFIFSTFLGMIVGTRLKPLSGTFYMLKYIEYLVIFYLVAAYVKDKKQVMMFLNAFIITFLIVNLYAFTQVGHGRVSAPFEGEIGEPNTLGGYQVLLIGVILGIVTHIKSSKLRIPLLLLVIFSLIPFIFTLSRSSYMAIIPMYLTLIFLTKSRRRNILLGVLIVLVIVSMFFFPQAVKDRIIDTFKPQIQANIPVAKLGNITFGPSASARINDWIRLYSSWQKSPFLGYGLTGMGFLDSQYIRTLVELGSVGLLAFIALLISIYRNTLRIYRNSKDDLFKGLALGFLAGHVGMIFHSVTANTFIIIRIMEPYWFLAAMVMVIPSLEKQEKQKEEEVKIKPVNRILRNSTFLLNGNNLN